MHIESVSRSPDTPTAGQPFALDLVFSVDAAIAFDPDVGLELRCADAPIARSNLRARIPVGWLPRGRWRARWLCHDGAGIDFARLSLHQRRALNETCVDARELRFAACPPPANAPDGHWRLQAEDGSEPALSWRRGHADWFFRHFDHAAGTIIDYMLGASPLLRGRILDVGCGDGITALSLMLRCESEAVVGIDPFAGFARLPAILTDNGLGPDAIPENIAFLAADANAMPFADDSFDVVVSWGSLEHIAGGYARALREIRRVLRPDGLLFAHPGLYYGNFGHHLGEFSSEPHFHLKYDRATLQAMVLNTPPNYIDRSGEFASPAQYWQWFEELNPIRVSIFEQELRDLDFEPWRVALRTEDRIEYSHELLPYPMQDLATLELYLSAWNRKHRPGSIPALRRQVDRCR